MGMGCRGGWGTGVVLCGLVLVAGCSVPSSAHVATRHVSLVADTSAVAYWTAQVATDSQLVVTRDLHISFLAPARTGPIVATAVALRVGRDSVVSHVRVVDTGAGNVLVAVGTLGAKSVGISIPIGPDDEDSEGRG